MLGVRGYKSLLWRLKKSGVVCVAATQRAGWWRMQAPQGQGDEGLSWAPKTMYKQQAIARVAKGPTIACAA